MKHSSYDARRSGSKEENGQKTKAPEGGLKNLMRDQLKLEVIELLPVSGKTEHNMNYLRNCKEI